MYTLKLPDFKQKEFANYVKKGPTVTDLLPPEDFDTLIQKYRVVEIYSKVGSGKNHWANLLPYLENEDGKRFNILYVTSRASTANAEAPKIGADRFINLKELKMSDLRGGTPHQVLAYCTNYGLADFVKGHTTQDIMLACQKLDVVILDEVHSLATDATFADCPFYIDKFMRFAVARNPKLTVIMMTGTPNPINWLVEWDIMRNPNTHHVYDLREKCYHVLTENVYFISRKEAFERICKLLKKNKKAVYFVDSVGQAQKLWNDFLSKKNLIDISEIGIGYSDYYDDPKTVRDGFDPELPESQREDVKKNLAEEEELPENIKLFITTIKNKEGININNQDINIMFCESLWDDEIRQMAGRLRNGVKELYIIVDHQYRIPKDDAIVNLDSCKVLFPYINSAYEDFLNERELLWPEYVHIFTRQIDEKFKFFKFDKLMDNKFTWYTGRENGNIHRSVSYRHMLSSLSHWDSSAVLDVTSEIYDRRCFTGEEYLRSIFDESKVHMPELTLLETTKLLEIEHDDEVRLYAANEFAKLGWLNIRLSKDKYEKKVLAEAIRIATELQVDYGTGKQLKTVLKNLHLELERNGSKSGYVSKKTGKTSSTIKITVPLGKLSSIIEESKVSPISQELQNLINTDVDITKKG